MSGKGGICARRGVGRRTESGISSESASSILERGGEGWGSRSTGCLVSKEVSGALSWEGEGARLMCDCWIVSASWMAASCVGSVMMIDIVVGGGGVYDMEGGSDGNGIEAEWR